MHLFRQSAFTPGHARARLLGLCALVLAHLPAQADEAVELLPFEASYTASMEKGLALNGTAKRSLIPEGKDTWMYRTDVDSFIVDIDESLLLKWQDNRVVPLRYRYRLSGFLISEREQSINFDWDAGVATGTYRGKSFELPLKEGALDPLGFQLQLWQDLKAGKREMTYEVIDGGDYDQDRFAVVDEEQITTPQGTLNTLKAEKVRDEASKRTTLMWFAPEQNFLLIRLLQVEPDDSRYELRLKKARMGD